MDALLFGISAAAFRYSMVSSSFSSAPAVLRASGRDASSTISYELLKQQNADTSTALIEHFVRSSDFDRLAQYEGHLTVQRDEEDASKLQVGIDFAKEKGVIDPNFVPEPYVTIDVLGKTPDQVSDLILDHVKSSTSSVDTGLVIVLVGLSGTGKGTTVAKLCQKLHENEGKKVVTWSNGNIFRAVTLLAASWCEQQIKSPDTFDADLTLTKENLASFMSMLSFGKFNDGEYDTRICGLGLDMLVSQVQNTELKSPKVSKNIPTVAQYTQGEVILFAAKAVETMGKDGMVVLLEGREQTVNYVRTPHRFALTLSDPSLIGKRRAAQRLMAAAMALLSTKDNSSVAPSAVEEALQRSLNDMVREIPSTSTILL